MATEKKSTHEFTRQYVSDVSLLAYPIGAIKASHITAGTQLMSTEGKPINVLTAKQGMVSKSTYIIKPITGDHFTVGDGYLLGLFYMENKRLIHMSVEDFVVSPTDTKSHHYLCTGFPKYETKKTKQVPILVGVEAGKNLEPIPDEYVYNDTNTRAQTLRGFLSGYQKRSVTVDSIEKKTRTNKNFHVDSMLLYNTKRSPQNKNTVTEFMTDNEQLRNQLVFLGRSLGYIVTIEETKILITGNINKTIKEPLTQQLQFDIEVKPGSKVISVVLDENPNVLMESCIK